MLSFFIITYVPFFFFNTMNWLIFIIIFINNGAIISGLPVTLNY